MDFVDEENGIGGTKELLVFGLGDDFSHFFHSTGDCTECVKRCIEGISYYFCESGFPHSWRSPEDER